MVTIGVAGCWAPDGRTVFPDADWSALEAALARRGVNAIAVAWEDPDVDWASFRLVVVRSTWTSVDLPDDYLRWVDAVATVTRIENPPPVIRWNLDKRHLLDLAEAEVPIVPTQWVEPGRDWEPPTPPFVVKPSISAGGRETALYVERPEAARQHVRRLHAAGQTVMVQPHQTAVANSGETKIVFIDGRYSHATTVGPLLEPDAGVMARPWEKPVSVSPTEPNRAEVTLAEAVVEYLARRFGTPLYARVDVVAAEHAYQPAVLELELVDPSLMLWAASAAADALADAIASRLK